MTPRIPDTHAEAWALLPWLANGRLGADEREWVEAHVAGCAECRAELASQRLVASRMSADLEQPVGGNDEQKSFNKLWARIEAAETATTPATGTLGGPGASRASRTIRWLAAAVVVQALGLGVLGYASMQGDAASSDDIVTVSNAEPRLDAPAVRIVFAPQASIDKVNTLLAHQELKIVAGPGTSGNYTAELSANAVASGASAESVAQVLSKDPNVSFAQPVAR